MLIAISFFFDSRIGEGLETCIPNLETLVLTNNGMQDLVSSTM